MSRITIRTENKKFPVAPNLYGIFFEDINRAGDGGLYPEMLRNRSFEDSIEPKDCHTEQDGYALVTRAGWRDEFNHGEGLSRWIRKNQTPYTPVPAWYTQQAVMRLEREDTLNKHRQAALSAVFEKDGKLYNTGFNGISLKAGETYSDVYKRQAGNQGMDSWRCLPGMCPSGMRGKRPGGDGELRSLWGWGGSYQGFCGDP